MRMDSPQQFEEFKSRHWWYHDIEVFKDKWTGGIPQTVSIPATRGILKHVDLSEMRVLDIGAMEGFFSLLASRKGPKSIMSTDRWDFSEKISYLQSALNAKFEYVPGISLDKIPARLLQSWGELSDCTIFSGVLYHMFDPMGGLARVRGFLRPNGIVVIETAAVCSDEACLVYNDNFWLYDPGTYFVPTTGWLNVVLPFLGFRPIDCRYFEVGTYKDKSVCRIAVCCRAADIPIFSSPPPDYAKGDRSWYIRYAKFDFAEFMDFELVEKQSSSQIKYESPTQTSEEDLLRLDRFYGNPELKVDPTSTRLRLVDAV
jgi:SAM-dependent methyltransferase